MNFIDDLRTIAQRYLDYYEVDYRAEEDTRLIVERWINIKLKLIQPIPREVFVSKEIVSKSLSDEKAHAFNEIRFKFERGIDITPHLSKTIFHKTFTDYLLSDWNIYHLHLSTEPENNGSYFVKRSDQLLFVMVKGNHAYFLDIRSHNENYVFEQIELLHIVYRNWSHLLSPYLLKGIAPQDPSDELSEPEIKKLRKGGVSTFYTIEGKVYAPMGGGVTTAKTSLNVTIQTDKLYSMARSAQKWMDEHSEEIENMIHKETASNIKAFSFKLELTEKGFCIVEDKTNIAIPIN